MKNFTGGFWGIKIILLMTHLSVDPACNASLLVNKLVERFILWFAGGNPRQGIRRLNCLCIHLGGSCQVELSLVGIDVRGMCGESLACLHPPPPHGQWAVDSLRCSNRLRELRDLSVNTATTVIHCNPLLSTASNITSPPMQLPLFTLTAK